MSFTLFAASIDLQWVVFPSLIVVFCLGVLATFAPDRFAQIASRGSTWVDTEKWLELLDKPINVDSHVLRYSRIFGVLVASAAVWLGYLYWTHFMR